MEQPSEFYPLTQSQLLMFYNLKFSYKKAIVNICNTLHFDCDIDRDLMLQAVTLAMLRNKSASIRLRKMKETDASGKTRTVVKQYFSDSPPHAFEFYSFDREEEMNAAIDKWSTTPFPNGAMDTQLYRVILFQKPDGRYAIYFCVNHIVFDAYSLMYTTTDMLDIYLALRDGKPMPAPLPSPLPAYEADWKYASGPQRDRDLAFWSDVFSEPLHFSDVNGLGSKNFVKGQDYGVTLRLWAIKGDHVNLKLPKEIVQKVDEYAASVRVSPQLLYLLALRGYMASVNGGMEDITLNNTIARRATKAQKHAGGTMVNAVAFRMNFSHDLTLGEACVEMQKLQSGYYRHGNLTTGDLLQIYMDRYHVPSCKGFTTMSLTYQPYSVMGDESLPFHFTRHTNGAATQPLYLTIMALDQSGDLGCNYEYMTDYVNPECIHKMHQYLLKTVEAMVDHPEKTLRELYGLSR